MSVEDSWSVIFYQTDSGRLPINEFLDEQDQKVRQKIEAAIELLITRNITARPPLAKHIEGKLWELRVEQNTNIFRVFYFFWVEKQIVLLHAFHKKSQKTPNKELQVARKRLQEYLD